MEKSSMESLVFKFSDSLRGIFSSSDYELVLLFLFLKSQNLLEGSFSEKDVIIKISSNIAKHKRKNEIEPIWQMFDVSRVSKSRLLKLIYLLQSLEIDTDSNAFADFFEQMTARLIKGSGKMAGQYYQPAALTEIMSSFIPNKKGVRVYNPFAGLASFAMDLPKDATYYGQEFNGRTYALAKMRLIIHDKQKHHVSMEDSLHNWLPESTPFDFFIANPPYGMRLSDKSLKEQTGQRTAEGFFLKKAFEANVKTITVLPIGMLFRGGREKQLRQQIVEADKLEYVIQLPGNVMYATGILTAILVLNPEKEHPSKVTFVNAESLTIKETSTLKELDSEAILQLIHEKGDSKHKRLIPNKVIAKNDFDLNVARYFQEELVPDEGFKFVGLNKLVEELRPRLIREEVGGKCLTIKNLSDSILKYELDVEAIEERQKIKPAYQVPDDCLLLTTRFTKLKPTYFSKADFPIYCSPNIQTYKVNEEKVLVEYLIQELCKDYVTKQLDVFRVGTAHPFIGRRDFLSVQIQLPIQSKQQDLVNREREIREDMILAEQGITSVIERERKKQLSDLRFKKHRLNNMLARLDAPLDNLIRYMKANEGKINADSLISQRFGITVEHQFTSMQTALQKVMSFINEIDSPIFVEGEVFDLHKEVKEMKRNFTKDKSFKFSYKNKLDLSFQQGKKGKVKPEVKFSKIGFNTIVEEIVENAKKHGFVGRDSGNEILVEMSLGEYEINGENRENVISLKFSNNGKPFDKGWTEDTFRIEEKKSGKTGNNGIGGSKITKIVEFFGGNVKPYQTPKEEMTVTIELRLPLNL